MKINKLSFIRVTCDGGCRRNGKENASAYYSYQVVAVSKDGTEEVGQHVDRATVVSDVQTNNVAEYCAVIAALQYVEGLFGRIGKRVPVTLVTDSELVCDQLTMKAKVKSENIKPLYTRAASLVDTLPVRVEWRPRENSVAVLGH